MNKKSIVLLIIMTLLFSITLFSSYAFASYTSIYSEPSITIRRGTYGTGVKWLQDMLNHNGYSLSIDGEFGNNTYNAVCSFQLSKNLTVDGIVGNATKSALKKYADSVNLKYKYTTTRVNFRSGPSTSYSSYGILNENIKVTLISSYNTTWSYVLYNNTYGYIASQYLSDSTTLATIVQNSNGLPTFTRNTSELIQIIRNCKAFYANNPFYYSTASGVRSIPADKSINYSGKYYVDCSSFVTWALYEYASANNNTAMKNYFSYQRNSSAFANIGANSGNDYLTVVSNNKNGCVDLSLAKPGDILVSSGHVEFFNSYTLYSPTYSIIKVYNCGSNTSIRNPGLTNSATLNPNNITYILRVK